MKKKNVIFDVDGVLLWSTKLGISILIRAIGVCGLKKPSFDELRLLWGCKLETELIPSLSQKLNWEEGVEAQVVKLFLDLSNLVPYPFQPGLAECLEDLIRRDYQLGIVTNRDLSSLLKRLNQQGIGIDLFRHVQAPDNGFSKPDPRVFYPFWNKFQFNKEETIYVGDSIRYDFNLVAQNYPELAFVAIASGLHTRKEFLEVGVPDTHIFNNVLEFLYVFPDL